MFKMLKLASVIFLSAIFVNKVWTADFKVAVVSHYPQFFAEPVTPEIRLFKNVDDYEELAKKNNKDYDIIVFPESTLYSGANFEKPSDIFPYSTLVPEPNSRIVACDENTYATFFKRLSCLSRTLEKYLVINLAEHESCREAEHCPIGYDVYNTNVIFNNKGEVVARYRKFNLFGEKYMSRPKMEMVTFDFKGVQIGIFTCFDLMFKAPAIDLVKKENVQAVIFTVMWYSELPFLTALQAQQQWARELDVTLIAAGANNPDKGSGGTGIYRGSEGAKTLAITSKKTSKVFYENLTNVKAANRSETILLDDIDKEAKEMDAFHLLKDNLKSYSSQLLNLNERNVEAEICNGNEPNRICCEFRITTSVDENILRDDKNHYQYRLVAFSGVRTFSGVATGGIESCAVVACKNKFIDSCGERFEDYSTISWPVTFTEIKIKSIFAKDEQKIQFPNSLRSNIRPLSVDESEWITKTLLDDGVVERQHILKKSQQRLMTFGIFGRDFRRDGQEVTPPIKENEEHKDKDKDDGNGSNFIKLQYGAMGVACLLFILNIINL